MHGYKKNSRKTKEHSHPLQTEAKYILKDNTSWLECKQRMEVFFNNSIIHHFNRLEFYDHPMKCKNAFDKFYLLFTAKRKNS